MAMKTTDVNDLVEIACHALVAVSGGDAAGSAADPFWIGGGSQPGSTGVSSQQEPVPLGQVGSSNDGRQIDRNYCNLAPAAQMQAPPNANRAPCR